MRFFPSKLRLALLKLKPFETQEDSSALTESVHLLDWTRSAGLQLHQRTDLGLPPVHNSAHIRTDILSVMLLFITRAATQDTISFPPFLWSTLITSRANILDLAPSSRAACSLELKACKPKSASKQRLNLMPAFSGISTPVRYQHAVSYCGLDLGYYRNILHAGCVSNHSHTITRRVGY